MKGGKQPNIEPSRWGNFDASGHACAALKAALQRDDPHAAFSDDEIRTMARNVLRFLDLIARTVKEEDIRAPELPGQ